MIDWGCVGDGAIGEDIGNLIPDAVLDHYLPAAALPALEELILGAYLDGLRETGWSADERLVRLAMYASAVKYDWLVPWMLSAATEARQFAYSGTTRSIPSFDSTTRHGSGVHR